MKKITLFVSLLLAHLAQAQPVITAVVDGTCTGGTPKVVEIYVRGTHDFTGDTLQVQANSNTTWSGGIDLGSFGSVTDDYVYYYNDGSNDNFLTEFPSASGKPAIEGGLSFNGDDRIRILASDGSVIDIFGTDGVDADDDYSQNGIDWRYRDSWAKRNPGQGPSATFDVNQWSFGGRDDLDGDCSASDTTPLEDDMGGIQSYLRVQNTGIDNLQIYPNPVSGGVLHLSAAQKIASVQIFDLSGKEIMHIDNGFDHIDVSQLNSGIYMVKVTANDDATVLVKLMIE